MTVSLILLTALTFGIGIGLSVWHTRRKMRAELAERLARKVEQELARRIMAELSGTAPRPPNPPDR